MCLSLGEHKLLRTATASDQVNIVKENTTSIYYQHLLVQPGKIINTSLQQMFVSEYIALVVSFLESMKNLQASDTFNHIADKCTDEALREEFPSVSLIVINDTEGNSMSVARRIRPSWDKKMFSEKYLAEKSMNII